MKGQSTICLQVETLIFLITVFFSFIAWRLLRRWRIKFRLQARAEPNRCGRGSCCWSTDPMRPCGAPRGKGNVAAASVNTRMRETELFTLLQAFRKKKRHKSGTCLVKNHMEYRHDQALLTQPDPVAKVRSQYFQQRSQLWIRTLQPHTTSSELSLR